MSTLMQNQEDIANMDIDELMKSVNEAKTPPLLGDSDCVSNLFSWKSELPSSGIYFLSSMTIPEEGCVFLSETGLNNYRLFLYSSASHLSVCRIDPKDPNTEELFFFNLQYSIISEHQSENSQFSFHCLTHWLMDRYFCWIKIRYCMGFMVKIEFFPYERKPAAFLSQNFYRAEIGMTSFGVRRRRFCIELFAHELLLFRAQNYSLHDLKWLWKEDANKSAREMMSLMKSLWSKKQQAMSNIDFRWQRCNFERFVWKSEDYYPKVQKQIELCFFWRLS